LLINPYPESALNEEAGKLFTQNYVEYSAMAKMYCDIYANKKKDSGLKDNKNVGNISETKIRIKTEMISYNNLHSNMMEIEEDLAYRKNKDDDFGILSSVKKDSQDIYSEILLRNGGKLTINDLPILNRTSILEKMKKAHLNIQRELQKDPRKWKSKEIKKWLSR